MSSRERCLQKPSTQMIRLTEARLVLTLANSLNPLSLCTWTELQLSYGRSTASFLHVRMIHREQQSPLGRH